MAVGPQLDAIGIDVDLIDLRDKARFGHPHWTLPFGGGIVREGDVTVEVRPAVEMATNEWRDFDEIRALAATTEASGGFMWSGDEIHVGDDILVGRDAMKLLAELNRRANERAGTRGAEYQQGYRDGVRDAQKAARDALNNLRA